MKLKHLPGLILFLGLTCLLTDSFAQAECDNGRYLDEVFPTFTKEVDVVYGSNYTLDGDLMTLTMDVYQPEGDQLAARPLLIMMHGGHYLPPPVGGDKTGEDVVPICEAFAKMGYVAVSLEYRTGMENFPIPGPDSIGAMKAVVRAVQDCKAGVRYFYKDALTTNTYKIDTNRIFIGGSSAGAVTTVHYIYADKWEEIPASIDSSLLGLQGGLEGLSGNPGYSSKIAGGISLSGAVGDTAWMEPGDEPLLSIHGTLDDLIPYGTDIVRLLTIYPLLTIHGPQTMDITANQIGIEHCFKTCYDAPHTPHMSVTSESHEQYLDTTIQYMKWFLSNKVCGGAPVCTYNPNVGIGEEVVPVPFSLYPNPAAEFSVIDFEAGVRNAWSYELFDLQGKKVLSAKDLHTSREILDHKGLDRGMYFLRVQIEGHYFTEKLLLD